MGSADEQYQVIVSERAAEMLCSHVRFLAQVNRQAAERLRREVIEAAESLQSFPERGVWLTDPLLPHHTYRKILVGDRYMLIYLIRDVRVYIDSIVDCRQDYQWLI